MRSGPNPGSQKHISNTLMLCCDARLHMKLQAEQKGVLQ